MQPLIGDLNLTAKPGQTVAIVGPTGAGKTTLAKGIMGLIPNPPGKILSGEVQFEGQDLLTIGKEGMMKIRGYLPRSGGSW